MVPLRVADVDADDVDERVRVRRVPVRSPVCENDTESERRVLLVRDFVADALSEAERDCCAVDDAETDCDSDVVILALRGTVMDRVALALFAAESDAVCDRESDTVADAVRDR